MPTLITQCELRSTEWFTTKADHTFHYEFTYNNNRLVAQIAVVTANVGGGVEKVMQRANENLVMALESMLRAAKKRLPNAPGNGKD